MRKKVHETWSGILALYGACVREYRDKCVGRGKIGDEIVQRHSK